MQTEPIRRVRPEILFNQRTASGFISFCSIALPPATSSVSIFPRTSREVLCCGDAQTAVGNQLSGGKK